MTSKGKIEPGLPGRPLPGVSIARQIGSSTWWERPGDCLLQDVGDLVREKSSSGEGA